jgi:cell division protein FtsZ
MLYEDAPPDSVKRSILYVLGGNDIPVRVLNSVSSIVGEIFNEDNTSIISSINTAEKSKVVMLTSVQGETHFDKYDPLSIIPADKTLDWEDPDCSINCELDLHQLE